MRKRLDHLSHKGRIAFEAALAQIEAVFEPCEGEVVDLDKALDRVLAHDLTLGDGGLSAGYRLTASDLSRLAEQAPASAAVVRRPRVGVLATGDELVPLGTALDFGQLPNSSTPLVSACVLRWDGRPLDLGIAADQPEALRRCLELAVDRSADLVVTVGGTGRGDRDFARPLLEAEGEIVFDGVALRGSHTTIFGRFRGCPVFALPGTPSACRIMLEALVRPAVLRLGGRPMAPVTVPARVADGFPGRPILSFEWAKVWREGDGFSARRLRGPGIGIWTSMIEANAQLVVPAEVAEVRAGDVLEARLLDAPAGYPGVS